MPTIHILTSDNEAARCGAELPDWRTTPQAEWPWREDRDGATCEACIEDWDEDRFDASLEDWIGDEEPQWSIDRRATAAHDAAADRYIEDRLAGGES